MKSPLLFLFIFLQSLLALSQNTYSVYFETGNTTITKSEADKLLEHLNAIPTDKIKTITFFVYNDDTGNQQINKTLAKKRAESLRNFFLSKKYNQPIEINYEGEIKTDNLNTLSKAKLNEIRNNNRRIDIIINNSTTNQALGLNKKTGINNTYIVYYESENIIAKEEDLNDFIDALKKIETTDLKSLALNIYNLDTGSRAKDYLTSKKRGEELKKIIKENHPNLLVSVQYKGYIKPEKQNNLTDTEFEALNNKHKRIEVIAKYQVTNKVTPLAQNTLVKNNTIKPIKKFFRFNKSNTVYTIYFKNKDNSIIPPFDNEALTDAIKNIDLTDLKSITINTYNENSGNKIADDNISKKRALNTEKILKQNSKISYTIVYKEAIKTLIRPSYSATHIQYLKEQNRRIEVVASYTDQKEELDLTILNALHQFTPTSRVGDRIYLKNSIFPDDKSIITKELAHELDAIVLQLKKYTNINIEVQGHICCTKGGNEALDKDTGKLELSTNRAKAVYNYFIKQKIDPERLRYKGLGSSKPLGYDEQLNKRIEFFITKS
jgi:outer membrane protein OmpA-like peptidoglycan-associated protein